MHNSHTSAPSGRAKTDFKTSLQNWRYRSLRRKSNLSLKTFNADWQTASQRITLHQQVRTY